MWRKLGKTGIVAMFGVCLMGMLGAGLGAPPLPPFPNKFAGNALVDGQPAPEGMLVFARIGDYESKKVPVASGGVYGFGDTPLLVGPPNTTYFNAKITFHATLGYGDVQATETSIFLNQLKSRTLDLNFPELTPAPTPTPTPTPTMTPTPTATPSLPIPGDTSVPRIASGVLIVGAIAAVVGVLMLVIIRRRVAT